MKYFAFSIALSGFSIEVSAQSTFPDLKGTWTGKGQSVVYGSNPHHPAGQAARWRRLLPPAKRDHSRAALCFS